MQVWLEDESSLFNHFVIFVLIVGILIFIMIFIVPYWLIRVLSKRNDGWSLTFKLVID